MKQRYQSSIPYTRARNLTRGTDSFFVLSFWKCTYVRSVGDEVTAADRK